MAASPLSSDDDLLSIDDVRALVRADVPRSVVTAAQDPRVYRQCVALLVNVQYENAAHFNEAVLGATVDVVDAIKAHILPDIAVDDEGSGDDAGGGGGVGDNTTVGSADGDVGDADAAASQQPDHEDEAEKSVAPPRDTTFEGCELTVIVEPQNSLEELSKVLDELRASGQAAKDEKQSVEAAIASTGAAAAPPPRSKAMTRSRTERNVSASAAASRRPSVDRLVLLVPPAGSMSAADVASLAAVLDLVVHFTVDTGTFVVEEPPAPFVPRVGDTVLVVMDADAGPDGDDDATTGGDTQVGERDWRWLLGWFVCWLVGWRPPAPPFGVWSCDGSRVCGAETWAQNGRNIRETRVVGRSFDGVCRVGSSRLFWVFCAFTCPHLS